METIKWDLEGPRSSCVSYSLPSNKPPQTQQLETTCLFSPSFLESGVWVRLCWVLFLGSRGCRQMVAGLHPHLELEGGSIRFLVPSMEHSWVGFFPLVQHEVVVHLTVRWLWLWWDGDMFWIVLGLFNFVQCLMAQKLWLFNQLFLVLLLLQIMLWWMSWCTSVSVSVA